MKLARCHQLMPLASPIFRSSSRPVLIADYASRIAPVVRDRKVDQKLGTVANLAPHVYEPIVGFNDTAHHR